MARPRTAIPPQQRPAPRQQRRTPPTDKGWRSDSVVVGYLHPSDAVGARFHKSLLDLLLRDAYSPVHTVLGTMDMSSGANITTARNTMVRDFLTTDATWLWLIDADMAFDAETLDKLLSIADAKDRPIVGGLCFRVTQANDGPVELTPTLYGMNDDTPPRTVVYHDYPQDALVQVAATGAACTLIHRRVFEEMRDSKRFQSPWTWYAETLYPEYNDVLSEDITFCLRAGALGFPIYVHTGIEIGHQKTIVATAGMFRALTPRNTDLPPTYAVIAGRDRHEMTQNLLADLAEQDVTVLLFDNGSSPPYRESFLGLRNVEIWEAPGVPLHEMWTTGIEEARRRSPVCNIAILNNDLRVGPTFLRQLGLGLRGRDDVWISYPDISGKVPYGRVMVAGSTGQTVTGYAFMLRGDSPLEIDTRFRWWYGDFDLEMQARDAGKYVVTVGGCELNHLEPNRSTKGDRLADAKIDEAYFAKKWDVDPASLFLARHPDFGTTP